MSQRAQPPTSGTHRPRAPPGAVASAVRPNLFRSQLTRRPTASSSNSADTVRLDVEVLSDSGEIVVRNQLGEIELGDPPTPILETDEPEDRDESESTLRTKGGGSALRACRLMSLLLEERQRLAEAVKHHSINHSTVPDQPEGEWA